MYPLCVMDGSLTEYRNSDPNRILYSLTLSTYICLFPLILRIYGRFRPCSRINFAFHNMSIIHVVTFLEIRPLAALHPIPQYNKWGSQVAGGGILMPTAFAPLYIVSI